MGAATCSASSMRYESGVYRWVGEWGVLVGALADKPKKNDHDKRLS